MANPLIRLLWVGKTKERWAQEGIEKYLKALGNMARVEVVELREHKAGEAGQEAALRKEAAALGKALGGAPYVLLDEAGRQASSLELAALVRDRARLDFVLGGAFGVAPETKAGAKETLSLSRMTLTHEMARIVLLEQLYRALMINHGRSYHH